MMPIGVNLSQVLMDIHAQEARQAIEKRRLAGDQEIDPQWRPVRFGDRLPCRFGRLLVALGQRLEQQGTQLIDSFAEQRLGEAVVRHAAGKG